MAFMGNNPWLNYDGTDEGGIRTPITDDLNSNSSTHALSAKAGGQIKKEITDHKKVLATQELTGHVKVDNKTLSIKDDGTIHVSEETIEEIKNLQKNFLKPYFIEYLASFNKFGFGTPTGVTKYVGGNYVLSVSGTAGDAFVTVISGNIVDSGATTKYPCVIRHDDGIFDSNKVIGTDGVNKVNLLRPLKRNITNGLLGNLHDEAQGQHYTELGYFAYAQHIYFATPRYSERNSVLAQFLPSDTSGKWLTNYYTTYNLTIAMKTTDDTFQTTSGKALSVNITNDTNYAAEWTENLNENKGYLEAFIGCSVGSVKVEFYLDGVMVDSKTVNREVERVIFPFDYAKTGTIKIKGLGGFPQNLFIGRVSWFVNDKYSKTKLIDASSKVVFIGDSWGEYHNKATTRELTRLITADGGNNTVLDFSKSAHSSTYAKVWFDEYVIKNKPDAVIIEYFTNDFNSIGGAVLQPFISPTRQSQDMNIATLERYVSNIKYMIDKAIENGIQPIVVMPASTNSESQTFASGNRTDTLWNGVKITNDTAFLKIATVEKTVTSNIESSGETPIVVKSKAINSSAREGVVVDSDRNLTGGSIQRWKNNGVDVGGIRHDGKLEVPATKLLPQQFLMVTNTNSRGSIYLANNASTNNIDELRIVIQLADGTFVQKKIQLID